MEEGRERVRRREEWEETECKGEEEGGKKKEKKKRKNSTEKRGEGERGERLLKRGGARLCGLRLCVPNLFRFQNLGYFATQELLVSDVI